MPKYAGRLALVAAVTLSLSSLASCGTPEAAPSPTPSVPVAPSATPSPTPSVSIDTVANLDGIKVSGAWGENPDVTVPTPMAIETTQSKVLVEGTGAVVPAGAVVEVHYAGINARTGETFDSSWSRDATSTFPLDRVVAGFAKGLEGKKVGDRVLVAMTGADGYDPAGGNPGAGIAVGDTLVFVVDLVETARATAEGAEVALPDGAPAYVLGDGTPPSPGADAPAVPTVTVPTGAAVPTETTVYPLVTGTGRAVGPSDFVQARYRSWSWKTGELLEDKYGVPQVGPIGETIPAWVKAVVGLPIGSRVMVVASPADSFPEGANNPPLEKGDTVVYVIDILFASPHQWQ